MRCNKFDKNSINNEWNPAIYTERVFDNSELQIGEVYRVELVGTAWSCGTKNIYEPHPHIYLSDSYSGLYIMEDSGNHYTAGARHDIDYINNSNDNHNVIVFKKPSYSNLDLDLDFKK